MQLVKVALITLIALRILRLFVSVVGDRKPELRFFSPRLTKELCQDAAHIQVT